MLREVHPLQTPVHAVKSQPSLIIDTNVKYKQAWLLTASCILRSAVGYTPTDVAFQRAGCIVGSGIDQRDHHPLHHAVMVALDAAAKTISKSQINARHELLRRNPYLRTNPKLLSVLRDVNGGELAQLERVSHT